MLFLGFFFWILVSKGISEGDTNIELSRVNWKRTMPHPSCRHEDNPWYTGYDFGSAPASALMLLSDLGLHRFGWVGSPATDPLGANLSCHLHS